LNERTTSGIRSDRKANLGRKRLSPPIYFAIQGVDVMSPKSNLRLAGILRKQYFTVPGNRTVDR